jgi:hypothetical protein
LPETSAAGQLLEQTEALAREQMMGLHGAMRNVGPMLEPMPGTERRRESVHVRGVEVRPGSRVRLRPKRRADVFDLALDGKTATVETIEQDFEDRIFVAVSVDDDPGRDLGALGKPAHRFFFRAPTRSNRSTPEPHRDATASSSPASATSSSATMASASRWCAAWRASRSPEGVRVIDFGIRGLDLAYALLDGHDAVVIVDAIHRGGPPGTSTLSSRIEQRSRAVRWRWRRTT